MRVMDEGDEGAGRFMRSTSAVSAVTVTPLMLENDADASAPRAEAHGCGTLKSLQRLAKLL